MKLTRRGEILVDSIAVIAFLAFAWAFIVAVGT